MYDFSRPALDPGWTQQAEPCMGQAMGIQGHAKLFFCEMLLSHQDAFHIPPSMGRTVDTDNYYYSFSFSLDLNLA